MYTQLSGYGFSISKFPANRVLGCIYGFRPVLILLFLVLPKSVASMYGFCILLGLNGASIVPPTSGVISRTFGSAALGTLMGIAFASHQLGSFFSTWLGGLGSY